MLTDNAKIMIKNLIDDRIKELKVELVGIEVKPFNPYDSNDVNDIRTAWELNRTIKNEIACRRDMIKNLERTKQILGI